MINNQISVILIDGPVLPRRVRRRWPAIILAVNRTANVPGRIIFLIVSIHTINGINTAGVPWGTKWANICWVLFNHPNIIKESHKGKAKVRVKVKWLVLVKIYGNNPIKLLNKIIENKETKIKVDPFGLIGPSKVLNSLCKEIRIIFQIILYREGINQYKDGIIKIPKKVLNQLRDKLKILEEGSKTENKLLIIFSLMMKNFYLLKILI